MSDQTPNLLLPFILPAQAQKHVTHNEAIELLDLFVQLTFESIGQSSPPASAEEGQAWVIGDNASGAWDGLDGAIATWRGGGWLFVDARDGWRAWVADLGGIYVRNNGTWQPLETADNLPTLGINATADTANRLSVASAATLLNHDGAGHQIKINKATAADTGSLLYQTGFSGRAEMGLAGEDNFSIKVTPDGASWTTALTIDAGTGRTDIGQALRLTPGTAPAAPTTGEIYFDSATSKLRCFDGTVWQDLF